MQWWSNFVQNHDAHAEMPGQSIRLHPLDNSDLLESQFDLR